jgi:acyl-CoA thioesterase
MPSPPAARIEFLAPARVGEVLTAIAEERALAGRSGIYDIDVTNQDGKRIAVFRGKSHRIQGELVKTQGE